MTALCMRLQIVPLCVFDSFLQFSPVQSSEALAATFSQSVNQSVLLHVD